MRTIDPHNENRHADEENGHADDEDMRQQNNDALNVDRVLEWMRDHPEAGRAIEENFLRKEIVLRWVLDHHDDARIITTHLLDQSANLLQWVQKQPEAMRTAIARATRIVVKEIQLDDVIDWICKQPTTTHSPIMDSVVDALDIDHVFSWIGHQSPAVRSRIIDSTRIVDLPHTFNVPKLFQLIPLQNEDIRTEIQDVCNIMPSQSDVMRYITDADTTVESILQVHAYCVEYDSLLRK